MRLPVAVFLLFAACASAPVPHRHVINGRLVSSHLPSLSIEVIPELRYIGRHSIVIPGVAAGERFIFVERDGERAARMLVVQFETILPESTEIYRYSFDQAETMAGHRFRHNTFAMSFAEAEREAPDLEAARTAAFLRAHRIAFDDRWVVSRFLTLGSEERRSEMIVFYMERGTEIPEELAQRSRAAFRVRR